MPWLKFSASLFLKKGQHEIIEIKLSDESTSIEAIIKEPNLIHQVRHELQLKKGQLIVTDIMSIKSHKKDCSEFRNCRHNAA